MWSPPGSAGWRDDALLVVRNPPGATLADRTRSGSPTPSSTTRGRTWRGSTRARSPTAIRGRATSCSSMTGRPGSSASTTPRPRPPMPRLRLDRVQLLATHRRARGQDRALAAAAPRAQHRRPRRAAGTPRTGRPDAVAKRHVTEPKKLLAEPPRAGADAHRRRATRADRAAPLLAQPDLRRRRVRLRRLPPGRPARRASPPWATSSRTRSGGGCC